MLGCAPRIHLESIDAADLDLSVGPVALVATGSDPLSQEALAGLRSVLVASGVRVVSSGPEAQRIVVDGPVYRDEIGVAPGPAGMVEATRLATLSSSWRLEDPRGAPLDALDGVSVTDRWWSDATTRDEAVQGLISADQVAAELARGAGAAYGHRLVSVRTEVTRRLYGRGALRAGVYALKAGDDRRALVSWTELTERAGDPRIVAWAHHDLAVAHERSGHYAAAVRHAEAAATTNPADEAYLAELRAMEAEHRPLMRLVEVAP